MPRHILNTGGGFYRRATLGRARVIGRERHREHHGLGGMGRRKPLVQLRFPFERAKEVGERTRGLRAAQEQNATWIQGEMKDRHKSLLQIRGQIDQEIPATQDVELAEGRVHHQVLRGKDHHLTDCLCHLIAMLRLDEESTQSFGRYVRDDVGRVKSLARLGDGVTVQVRGKDLQRRGLGEFELLVQFLVDDAEGISFLAAGARGDPSAQRLRG